MTSSRRAVVLATRRRGPGRTEGSAPSPAGAPSIPSGLAGRVSIYLKGHNELGSCSWCGGSGTWIDPETGEKWPCIQCRYGRDGSDNFHASNADRT